MQRLAKMIQVALTRYISRSARSITAWAWSPALIIATSTATLSGRQLPLRQNFDPTTVSTIRRPIC